MNTGSVTVFGKYNIIILLWVSILQQQSTSIQVAIWHINKQMQGTKMISTSLAEDAFGGKLELYSGLQIIFKRYTKIVLKVNTSLPYLCTYKLV